TAKDRIELFKDKIGQREFSRKDYLQNFKEISQATASRDLKWAVEKGILEKSGDKRLTKYQFY
ncbi:MAG: Fic family protein, partial [Aequorivita sp.]|nr:Fic family protein [Aequorivita sp.]